MAKIEKDTNQLLRKKYFVDSKSILAAQQIGGKRKPINASAIIDSSKVKISNDAVYPTYSAEISEQNIKVDIVREENAIKRIIIKCPCGRHAQLDCEYAQDSGA